MGFKAEQDGPQRPRVDFSHGKRQRSPLIAAIIASIQIFLLFCFVRIVALSLNVFVFGHIPVLDPFLRGLLEHVQPYL